MNESLQELYGRFLGNRPLSDPEWMDVNTMLAAVADRAVRTCAARYSLPEFTIECRIDDVRSALMEKFLRGVFDPRCSGFEAVLATTARRDVITVLRAIKSPMAMSAEREEGPSLLDSRQTPDAGDPGDHDRDEHFDMIRSRLRPFRWPEYSTIRELLLSFLLAGQRYPGPEFLIPIVPRSKDREAVYNAAVYDLNTAILGITDDVSRAA